MSSMTSLLQAALILALPLAALAQEAMPAATTLPSGRGEYDVGRYGAVGDGKTDATTAFQTALDAAGREGGGVVVVGRGNYLFKGHLNVPNNVTLKGVWESVPSHNGIRDRGMPKPTDDGTTLLITEGAGTEAGPPFITLNTNSTLKGVVLYYPEQSPGATPKPYPWAVAMRGKNPAVLDVEMLNPFNGIDASRNERHLIRNVTGQPLRRGVYVDAIFDIGRIENVHFNPWWSQQPEVRKFQTENGEAFIFARSDWQYVLNTFCFGYNVGYKFVTTQSGSCNGNFLGIGADGCHKAVVVEQSAPFGLLITNGEFVAMVGSDPTQVEVGPRNAGTVRFSNCAFWGPCNQIAKIAGRGTVGFGDCTFVQWDLKERDGRAALQVEGGTVLVRGCEFRQQGTQVSLGEEVRRAVITGNVFTGPEKIANSSKGSVRIADNADTPPATRRSGSR